MYKFLPNTRESFTFTSKKSLLEIGGSLSPDNNMFGIPKWQYGLKNETLWFRLTSWHLFLVLPIVTINLSGKKNGAFLYDGTIHFSTSLKLILKFWLFFSILIYFVFSTNIFFELTFGDGLIAFTLNDVKQPDIHVFPWLVMFLVIHFLGFFIYPATVISLGWKKTVILKNKIIGLR